MTRYSQLIGSGEEFVHDATPALRRVPQTVAMGPVTEATPAEAPEPNPLRKIHELLRGRYLAAVIIAIVWAACAGILAYELEQPEYQSSGIIRIRPYLPRILYDNEESGVLPMFDAFASWQTELLRSRRVIDLAREDDRWVALGRPSDPEAEQEFIEHLEVIRPARGQMISVSFTDPDPVAASAAVRAVMDAYMRTYGESDAESESRRLRVLEERRSSLSNELAVVRNRVLSIANEYGSDSLEDIYKFKVDQMHKFEAAYKETLLAIASVDDKSLLPQPPPAEPVAPTTPEDLAVFDARVQQLLDQRTTLKLQIETYTTSHPRRRELERQLGMIESMLETRLDAVQRVQAAQPVVDKTMPAEEQRALLQKRSERLKEALTQVRDETLALGRRELQIAKLKEEASAVEDRLKETQSRIEELNVESASKGWVEVVSRGTTPTLPVNSRTRVQMAVAGVVGGWCGGVGFVILLGLMNRRLRSSTDPAIVDTGVRIIGILPHLSHDCHDEEEATVAACCVHRIRAGLQIAARRNDDRVFTVTSPVPRTGKSSLTLSLGLSFALARSNTLLIDADLCGRGLTARIQSIIRQHMIAVLTERNLIPPKRIKKALAAARKAGHSLENQLLSEQLLCEATLAEHISIRELPSIGICDVFNGRPLEECIFPTGIPSLSILPSGRSSLHDMSRMTPDVVRPVLEAARAQYDTVLVDTGPLGGDVGTAVVAAESDRVILVVSRGEPQRLVDDSVRVLRAIDARLAGVVFNRAHAADMAHSMHSHSMAWMSSQDRADRPVCDKDQAASVKQLAERFGPIASAIIYTSRVTGTWQNQPQGQPS